MGHSTYVVYIRSSMVDWLTLKISPLVGGFALGAYVIQTCFAKITYFARIAYINEFFAQNKLFAQYKLSAHCANSLFCADSLYCADSLFLKVTSHIIPSYYLELRR